MSGREGLDWAWGWAPGKGKQIAATGATFVARYLANLPNSKVITRAEVADLSAAGLDIVLVWETTTGRARAGMDAGKHDATEALRQARALGMPDDRPIYFAVDEDTTAYAVGGYFHGVWSVLGNGRVGVYGSYAVCKGLRDTGAATWLWQTYAWSGGKWDPRAQLQQYHNGVRVAGLDADNDRATVADFGEWRLGQPRPQPQEEDMTKDEHDLLAKAVDQGRNASFAHDMELCYAAGRPDLAKVVYVRGVKAGVKFPPEVVELFK